MRRALKLEIEGEVSLNIALVLTCSNSWAHSVICNEQRLNWCQFMLKL